MFGIFNLVLAIAMGVGGGNVGTQGIDDGTAGKQSAGYTVHFETTTGYPVKASLTFATKAEAEAFAQAKQGHGYTVQITQGK
jgi:hypothetical protein